VKRGAQGKAIIEYPSELGVRKRAVFYEELRISFEEFIIGSLISSKIGRPIYFRYVLNLHSGMPFSLVSTFAQ
jgi:hypothetical protein